MSFFGFKIPSLSFVSTEAPAPNSTEGQKDNAAPKVILEQCLDGNQHQIAPLSRFQAFKNYVGGSRPAWATGAALNILKGTAQGVYGSVANKVVETTEVLDAGRVALATQMSSAKVAVGQAYDVAANAAGKLKAFYNFDPQALESGYSRELAGLTGSEFMSLSIKSLTPFITKCIREQIQEKAQKELNGWEKVCDGLGDNLIQWVLNAGNRRFEDTLHVNILKVFCHLAQVYKDTHPEIDPAAPITLENLLSMLGKAVLEHKNTPEFKQNLQKIHDLQVCIKEVNAKAEKADKELTALISHATLGMDKSADDVILEKIAQYKEQYAKFVELHGDPEDESRAQEQEENIANCIDENTAKIVWACSDREKAKKAGQDLQKELNELRNESHQSFSKEILTFALPNGAADLELPEPAKEFVWELLSNELPPLLADISEELVGHQAIQEKEELKGSGPTPVLQNTIAMAGEFVEEALPQFLANGPGSEFITDLLKGLFSGSDAIKGVIARRWPEQIQNIGASQDPTIQTIWPAFSTYSEALLTHVTLSLSKFGSAVVHPQGFIACDAGIFDFALEHMEQLRDSAGQPVDQQAVSAMIRFGKAAAQEHVEEVEKLNTAIATLKQSELPSKEADLKKLKDLKEERLNKLEILITPVTDLMKPLEEMIRIHRIKENCKGILRDYLEEHRELRELMPQAVELNRVFSGLKSGIQANENTDENAQLLKEAQNQLQDLLQPLKPLFDRFREAAGLDNQQLLARFPFAGLLLENAFKELNAEVIPTLFLKLYTDVYLPSQNQTDEVAELQNALSTWFTAERSSENPGIADHLSLLTDSLVKTVDEISFAYLKGNAQRVAELIREAFPEYALNDQNQAFLQKAITQITDNEFVSSEIREYVRGLMKSAVLKIAAKTIQSENSEKQKKLLGCVGRLISGPERNQGSQEEFFKNMSTEIFNVLVDQETLESIPLPAKDLLVEAAKTSILPSILKEVQEHTTAWIGEAQQNREELYRLTGQNHVSETCRVLGEYVRDYMPFFFGQNNPKIADMLHEVIRENLRKSGQTVPTAEFLQANSPEAKAFISGQMRILSESQDPDIRNFYKGISEYTESTILKIAVGVFKSIHAYDTEFTLFPELEEECKLQAEKDCDEIFDSLTDDEKPHFDRKAIYAQFLADRRRPLVQERILERRLRLVTDLLRRVVLHFEAIDSVRKEQGKSHGYEVPLSDKLNAFSATSVPAGIPRNPLAPQSEKDDIRIEGFFGPLMTQILEMADITGDNLAIWEPIRAMAFDLFAKSLLPQVALSIGTAAVEPENIDALLINVIDILNKSLAEYSQMSYEELVEAATSKAALQRQARESTFHEGKFKEQLGGFLETFFRLMPTVSARLIIGIDKFKELSADQLGALMADVIRETPLGLMVDKMIEAGLPSLHPDIKNDQWVGTGKDRRFVHYRQDVNGETVVPLVEEARTFNCAEEPITVKKKKVKENRQRLTDTLLECFKSAMHNLWRSLMNKVNVKVKTYCGRFVVGVKLRIDSIIQKITAPVWKILKIISYPVVAPVKFLWRLYVKKQGETLRNNLADPVNEVLVQNCVTRVMNELQGNRPVSA
jgi:hypothetical protein